MTPGNPPRRQGQPPQRPRPRKRPTSTPPRNARGQSTRARASGGRTPAKGRPAARRPRSAIASFARGAALFIALLVLAVGVTGCAVYTSMSKQLPDPDLSKARGRDQSTVILDRRGREIAKLYAEEDRKDVAVSDMPAQLRQAVIATEDRRFYEHQGVDPMGIARALVVDAIKGEKAQGGSTITQQYVKQAFVTSEKTLKRKVQEAILAQKVDRRYSKDEILERYLNTIYFGHAAYGVEAASRVYFGKSVTELTLAESAMLAGVIKSPGRYSPYLEPERALLRRNTVLNQMRDQGVITEAACEQAKATPIEVVGLRPRSNRAPYFVEWVKAQLIENYGERAVYRGGLVVKTTLDLTMQKAAQRAIDSNLDHKDDPSAAVVAVRPGTGEVLAMVGGRDFKTQQYNVAVQGRRQPGSAFKPFVLVTALSQGVSPEQTYESGPVKLQVGSGVWSVTGAHGSKGPMRLRPATEQSVNSVFAQLILDVGPEDVVETAEKMGIDRGIEAVPAIALGGLEHGVSPLRMAESYATLAANGMHATSFGVFSVTGPDGKVLERHRVRRKRALDADVAYLTTDILRGVIKRGTGTAANIGRPAAGKTGTTQKYRDAWFTGYTPDIATAVWVGYPDAQREMTSVHGRKVTGGSFPAEIWHDFMSKVLDGRPETAFERPPGLKNFTVCNESGQLITPFCPDPISALMLSGSKVESCTIHATPVKVRVPVLVGMTKADALAALDALGLTARVTETQVANVASGMVAAQSPRAGTVIAPTTPVNLTVSAGTAANQPPVALFTVPNKVNRGKPIGLDGSTSTDDGKIVTYYWEFGDGATGTGSTVTHSWSSPGTYEVTLWVTDDSGGQGSVTHSIIVR